MFSPNGKGKMGTLGNLRQHIMRLRTARDVAEELSPQGAPVVGLVQVSQVDALKTRDGGRG
ncbi:MAG: hypothetical protein AAFO75_08960 [Pseudomonadota bacterium]